MYEHVLITFQNIVIEVYRSLAAEPTEAKYSHLKILLFPKKVYFPDHFTSVFI